jgi:Cu(I)/Ag(I) efflux system protein CusF
MNRMLARLAAALAVALAGGANAADLTDGEIRKVDKEAAKLTIRHAEIRNLDMPPMTMVFHVKDAKMLDRVKAGDKVRFAAEKLGGNYTVTALEPAAK